MHWFASHPTPQSWAATVERWLIPIFVLLGLILGVLARAWMRLISVDPEFTWGGTLAIVLSFAFFALTQAVAAMAAQRPWSDWPRRAARLLGLVGILPLFSAAGAVMAPAVLLAGLAVWHPKWPVLIRAVLGALVIAVMLAVAAGILSDFGFSVRSLIAIFGFIVIYGCIIWMAAGTFSSPRAGRPALSTTASVG